MNLKHSIQSKKNEPNAEIYLAQKELLSSLKFDLVSLEKFEERLESTTVKTSRYKNGS